MRNLFKIVTRILFTSYMVHTLCLLGLSKELKIQPVEVPNTLPCNYSQGKQEYDDNGHIWSLSDVNISHVKKSRKLIALTFDDAPASTLEEILKVFLNFNATHPDAPASATIFCNGKNIVPSTKRSLQTALAAGFELGNHTQNHKNLFLLSPDEIRKEITQTDQLLYTLDKKRTHLLRAPYGNVNNEVRSASTAPIISWFIDTLDWTGISAEEIYDTVWQGKFCGAIVLMHDGYENTSKALERLLPELYDTGYQAVTVSQMAKAHHRSLECGGVYTRIRPISSR